MSRKSNLWYKVAALILVLVLIVPILVACGGGEKTPTATAIITPTATATATPTATPASGKPVKIGVIQDWSGPGAMAGVLTDGMLTFLEWYYNEKQGGILGGRPIKFVKCDMQGQVAIAAACAKKLAIEEKVSIITEGGTDPAHAYPICEVTDPLKVPFVSFTGDPQTTADYKWTAQASYNVNGKLQLANNIIIQVLKPKTVAYFASDTLLGRDYIRPIKEKLEAAGIKTVYEMYQPQGITDLSPYLTKIKYEAPDLLVTSLSSQEVYGRLAKQIMELGGWGDMKHMALQEHAISDFIRVMPGAAGWYAPSMYAPGRSDQPGPKAFEEAWREKFEKDPSWGGKYSFGKPVPNVNHGFFHNCLTMAITAIELAGTDDPAAVAEVLRSGKLEFDSAWGHIKVDTNGETNAVGLFWQIQKGGGLVEVK
ncbi:MAG: ABC transporter substrate-binding protein [Dehalococcoidia bacterium]